MITCILIISTALLISSSARNAQKSMFDKWKKASVGREGGDLCTFTRSTSKRGKQMSKAISRKTFDNLPLNRFEIYVRTSPRFEVIFKKGKGGKKGWENIQIFKYLKTKFWIWNLFNRSLKLCRLCNLLRSQLCQFGAVFKIHLKPWKAGAFPMNSDLFNIKSDLNTVPKQQKLRSKQQPNLLSALTGEQAIIPFLQHLPNSTLQFSY